MSVLIPPAPPGEQHDLTDFASGEDSLDIWLKRRAQANQLSGVSRTFVLCLETRVIGYYALASGAIAVDSSLGRFNLKTAVGRYRE